LRLDSGNHPATWPCRGRGLHRRCADDRRRQSTCRGHHPPRYVDPSPYMDFGVFDIVLSFLPAGLALGHAVHLFILELAFQRRGI
ncbi:hypothetical protein, partial [Brevibacterium sp.]|uniref:hypothetical protein n=1 Tax=Brevibacterium sp. TaxID=1701 RepID=UPI00264856C3